MSLRNQGSILGVGFNPLQAPNAPTGVTGTAGSAQVSVAFTAPTNVGGSAISRYVAISNPGNFNATGASSPLVVTGLTNGTAYTFQVTALNSYGPSPISAASGSVTPSVSYYVSWWSYANANQARNTGAPLGYDSNRDTVYVTGNFNGVNGSNFMVVNNSTQAQVAQFSWNTNYFGNPRFNSYNNTITFASSNTGLNITNISNVIDSNPTINFSKVSTGSYSGYTNNNGAVMAVFSFDGSGNTYTSSSIGLNTVICCAYYYNYIPVFSKLDSTGSQVWSKVMTNSTASLSQQDLPVDAAYWGSGTPKAIYLVQGQGSSILSNGLGLIQLNASDGSSSSDGHKKITTASGRVLYGVNGNAMALDASGNIFVSFSDYGVGGTVYVAKFNNAGTLQWARALTTLNGVFYQSALTLDANGNPYVAINNYQKAVVLVAYDTNGALQWKRRIDITNTTAPYYLGIGGLKSSPDALLLNMTGVDATGSVYNFPVVWKLPLSNTKSGAFSIPTSNAATYTLTTTDTFVTDTNATSAVTVASVSPSFANFTLSLTSNSFSITSTTQQSQTKVQIT